MGNQTLQDFAAFGDLLDLGKISMLIIATFFLLLVNRLLQRLAKGLMAKIPSRRFMILQFTTLLSFVWYIGGFTAIIAGILRPPKELLIALIGSAAVAIGIALKDVAASVIAGLILLFDRPFQVGDRVSFSGTYGEIISIGLRSVRLVTLDDNLVTIPNSRFITEVVASGNAGALDMMVVCDFHLAMNADLTSAQKLVHEAIVTSRFAYLKKPVTFVINEVIVAERLAILLRAKAYVLDVRYEKAFQTDVFTRVTQLFNERQISRPTL